MNKFTQQSKKRSLVVIRGAWTDEEDKKLSKYVEEHGQKKWETVALKAGLNRCGKSCRLRWLNYLRPNIKRGNITPEEDDLILRLHKLLGNRWSLIAGRLPGRTDNEIKNYWNSHLSKKLHQQAINIQLPAPPGTYIEFPAPPTTTTSTIMEESIDELEETTLWEESGGDNVGSEDTKSKSSFDDISEILDCSSEGACDVDWADQFLVLEQPGY